MLFRRVLVLLAWLMFALPAHSQKPKLNAFDYALAHDMLHDAYNDVKKNYYDPQYHGIDLDARYHEFEARLANVARPCTYRRPSTWNALGK